MEKLSLQKILLTTSCFINSNINILMLNKEDINFDELVKTRNDKSNLIKDENFIDEIILKMKGKEIFNEEELNKISLNLKNNDIEITIHDLSHVKVMNEEVQKTFEFLINNCKNNELNIVLVNKNIIEKYLKYLYKCIYINTNDDLDLLIEHLYMTSILHFELEEKVIENYKNLNSGKNKEFVDRLKEVQSILENFKNKENGFVKKDKKNKNISNDKSNIEKMNSKFNILNIIEPKESFKDIIGLDSVKKMLTNLIKLYSEDIDNLKKYKIERDKGFILYGEPGTGKTMLCKAFAKELNAIFVYLSMEQFLSKKSETMSINNLFEEIEEISEDYPDRTILVFLDELDSLRARGSSDHNNSYYDGFTNEMLYRIDNLPKNVMIIGATNKIESLDKALIRKGRLGNKYEVINRFKKEEIIDFIKKFFKSSNMVALNKYANYIATMIYYMNGSEISNILNKIKQAYYFRNNKDNVKTLILDTIYTEKYNLANYEIKPEEEKIVAYHESGHALAYIYFYGIDNLHEASIYPTEKALGFVSYKFDKNNLTKEDLRKKIIISLAGRYAEKLISNDLSIGASSDLENANRYISQMIKNYGMGKIENFNTNKNELSDYILTKFDKEHEELLKKYSKETEELIDKNKDFIKSLSSDLIKDKVLIDVFDKYEKLINKEEK